MDINLERKNKKNKEEERTKKKEDRRNEKEAGNAEFLMRFLLKITIFGTPSLPGGPRSRKR